MERRFLVLFCALTIGAFLSAAPARAFLDLGDFQNLDPDAPIPQGLADAMMLTIGGAADHRPSMAGTPLNDTGAGLDLSVQMSMVMVPEKLGEEMEKNGSQAPQLP